MAVKKIFEMQVDSYVGGRDLNAQAVKAGLLLPESYDVSYMRRVILGRLDTGELVIQRQFRERDGFMYGTLKESVEAIQKYLDRRQFVEQDEVKFDQDSWSMRWDDSDTHGVTITGWVVVDESMLKVAKDLQKAVKKAQADAQADEVARLKARLAQLGE